MEMRANSFRFTQEFLFFFFSAPPPPPSVSSLSDRQKKKKNAISQIGEHVCNMMLSTITVTEPLQILQFTCSPPNKQPAASIANLQII